MPPVTPQLDYAAPDRGGRGAGEMLGDLLAGGVMVALGVAATLLTLGLELMTWESPGGSRRVRPTSRRANPKGARRFRPPNA